MFDEIVGKTRLTAASLSNLVDVSGGFYTNILYVYNQSIALPHTKMY
jgi:hypothetical protein